MGGQRAQTRNMFSKKKRGMPPPSTLLKTFQIGDYVDIKMNPAICKGMAYR